MEATYSSETSVDFQRTTRRYIPDDIALENQSLFWQLQGSTEDNLRQKCIVYRYKQCTLFSPPYNEKRNIRNKVRNRTAAF
jgi:hypothetical protein